MFRKNVSGQVLGIQAIKASDGTNLTGATIAVRRCIDGAFAAATGTITEDSLGAYKFAMSQADTNGNNIQFWFTATGMISVCLNIVTTACDPTTATNFGITSLPTTAVSTNASLLTSGTGTDQLSVASGIAQANVEQWDSVAIAEPTTDGIPDVNVLNWKGTAVPTPATAGIPDVNGKAINNVSTSPVTTVKAVIGLTTADTITTTTNLTNLPSIPANWLTAAGINAAALNGKGDWATVNPTNLTAAQIATGVWQDATAGDFTAASSIGKSVMNGVALGTGLTINGYTGNTPQTGDAYARLGAPAGASVSADIAEIEAETDGIAAIPTSNPSAASIATAVWQDATAGDFTTASSIGKSLYNAFTVAGGSVYTVASLANAPTGGSAPTTAQIATAIWQDLTSGSDFGTANSIGALLKANIDAAISSRSTFAGGAVASVTAGVSLTSAERDAVANDILDLANGVEASVTVRQTLRAMAAILAGIISGAGSGTETFKGIGQAAGGTTRAVVTVDASGNRSVELLTL